MPSSIIRPDITYGENRLGYIAYGFDGSSDWVFQGPRVKIDFEMEAVYDDAGRVVTHHIGHLAVRAFVTIDQAAVSTFTVSDKIGWEGPPPSTVSSYANQWATQGSLLKRMMSTLNRSGGRLMVVGWGYDIDINTDACTFDAGWGIASVPHQANTYKDVGFGPKPDKFKITSHGPVLSEVFWSVSFKIIQCGSDAEEPSIVDVDNFRELNFGVDYNIDAKGLTRQTVSGYYVAYSFRDFDDRKYIRGTADALVDYIKPEVPLGFRRLTWNRKLSLDKTRMDFTIIDEQINSKDPWPKGTTDIRVTQTFRASATSGDSLGLTVTLAFNGYIEVSLNHDLQEAWTTLILVLQDRVDAFRINFQGNGLPNGGYVYITGVSIAEELFGPKRITFSLELLGKVGTGDSQFNQNLIQKAGLFRSMDGVPGLSWEDFRDSHKDLTWSPRGLAALEFRDDMDIIVSACEGTTPADISNTLGRISVEDGAGSLTTQCPPKEASYLLWDCSVDLITSAGRSLIMGMQETDASIEENVSLVDKKGTEVAGNFLSADENMDKIFSQSGRASDITVVIRGRALRAGRYPKIPDFAGRLKDNAGVSTDDLKRGSDLSKNKKRVKGTIGECKIFEAKWELSFNFVGTREMLQDTIDEITAISMSSSDDVGGGKGGNLTPADD